MGDKPDKVPYSARSRRRASSTDLLTWSTFQEALEAYETGEYAGLGFMFSSADPYTGIDLDNCVDEDGEIALWAQEMARYFGGRTSWAGHLREWRPLRIARSLYTTPKTQNDLRYLSVLCWAVALQRFALSEQL